MQKLFTEGLRGEPQKEIEIGLIPESWEVVELKEHCIQKKNNDLPKINGIRIYVGLEHISSGDFYLKQAGIESSVKSSKSIFNTGDILYGKLRPYLDKAVIVKSDGLCSTDIIVLIAINGLDQYFLLCLIHGNRFLEYAKATTSGVNHPRTSWNALGKFQFGLPSATEQLKIAKTFKIIEQKILIHEIKKKGLEVLFKSLLNKLMTGQIRVKDIEFEGMENIKMA